MKDDANPGQSETVSISLSNGALTDRNQASDNSVTGQTGYTVTGTAQQVSADLDALVNHPSPYAPGETRNTVLTINGQDTPLGQTATDNTTSVLTNGVAPPPPPTITIT